MRMYLKGLFVVLGVLAIAAALMWLGTIIPLANKLWILSIAFLVIAVVLFVGYKGNLVHGNEQDEDEQEQEKE